jgi:hypothetical protein
MRRRALSLICIHNVAKKIQWRCSMKNLFAVVFSNGPNNTNTGTQDNITRQIRG